MSSEFDSKKNFFLWFFSLGISKGCGYGYLGMWGCTTGRVVFALTISFFVGGFVLSFKLGFHSFEYISSIFQMWFLFLFSIFLGLKHRL
jgi:hypothetical protein